MCVFEVRGITSSPYSFPLSKKKKYKEEEIVHVKKNSG
jgi:hypothetical protein